MTLSPFFDSGDLVDEVNPMTACTVQVSAGLATQPGGKRVPAYSPVSGFVRVQALTAEELQHLNGLNINGVLRKLYARGSLNSVIRDAQTGGDLVLFGGQTWKVVHVFETWADWCAVAVSLQVQP